MESLKHKYSGIFETVDWPVHYDEENYFIRDNQGRTIMAVKISKGLAMKLDAPIDIQEQVGELIVELLNEIANE